MRHTCIKQNKEKKTTHITVSILSQWKKKQAHKDQHENDIEVALVNTFLPKDGNNQQSAEKQSVKRTNERAMCFYVWYSRAVSTSCKKCVKRMSAFLLWACVQLHDDPLVTTAS